MTPNAAAIIAATVHAFGGDDLTDEERADLSRRVAEANKRSEQGR